MKDEANFTAVNFSDDQVSLVLEEQTQTPIQMEQYEGRHAIGLADSEIKRIYNYVKTNHEELIVHDYQELPDKLGLLLIVIIKDFDGYEICLVSEQTFNKLAVKATDYVA